LLYAACAPWLLMYSGFPRGVQGYCLLAILCGTLTFLCSSLLRPDPPLSVRSVFYAGTGLLMTTLLIIIATSLQGMSVHMLVQGVFLDPMKLPDVFFGPLRVRDRTLTAAAIASLGLISMWPFRRRLAKHTTWIDGIRCAVGAGTVLLFVIS